MAKVTLSEPIESISGGYNKKYYMSTHGSKTILVRRPEKSDKEPTDKQKAQQEKFSDGAVYGGLAKNDPERWAWYKSLKDTDNSAFNMALADFCSSPVVRNIDTTLYQGHAGDQIRVNAYQKFRVTDVTVRINASDGTLVEEGQAVSRDKTGYYLYVAVVEIPDLSGMVITAVATDTPGHQAELSKTLLSA